MAHDQKQQKTPPSSKSHDRGHEPPHATPPSAQELTRRMAMAVATVAIGAGTLLIAAIPAAIAIAFPAKRRTVSTGEGAIDAISLNELPADRPVRITLTARDSYDAWAHRSAAPVGAVYLQRAGSGNEVRCLSSVCPHLGCFVDWNEEKKAYDCPCHKSTFEPDGTRRSGPSPRGLDPLPVEIKQGRVRVHFARFVQNIGDRIKL